jgi:serine/threonine protein kinase
MRTLTVNIENVFQPFTQSQVLKVKLNNPTHDDPEHAVLKLFDRRFFERSAHPWDELKEKVLLQFMADVENGARKDDYEGKDSDDYEDWDWERKYRVVNQELFQNEATVYEHLRPLQGSIIPRRYALVHVLNATRVPGFLGEVPGLLLEYIEGNTMDELEVGTNISQDDAQQAGLQAFDIMHHLRDHNVIHFDLRLANFIVSIVRPLRVVIIDFAISRIRDEDETDEDWEEEVRMEDEVHGMRLKLHRHRFRDRTPPPPVEGFAGYIHFNRMIERERPDWRSRHYEPVIRKGGHLEVIDDRKGGRKEYHHAAWKLKT